MEGLKDTAESVKRKPSHPSCGRRQIQHTELITNGLSTKPGDWPWHAAVYWFEKNTQNYRCGGTLISKNVVITGKIRLKIKKVRNNFLQTNIKHLFHMQITFAIQEIVPYNLI